MDTLPIYTTCRLFIVLQCPTAHFAYGHRKNTYPAIHTVAVSIVITQFLLYIV